MSKGLKRLSSESVDTNEKRPKLDAEDQQIAEEKKRAENQGAHQAENRAIVGKDESIETIFIDPSVPLIDLSHWFTEADWIAAFCETDKQSSSQRGGATDKSFN
uniref:Uncharacterized protein n=1 Tax=Panagrellus redivivus TaxID=6233 RepID=A0A7E4W5M0_PANRE